MEATRMENHLKVALSTDKEKRMIIFGAGDIGRQALNYWGEEKIAFFVDNAHSNVGKCLGGKLIISWDDYIKIHNKFYTVVAIRSHHDVDRQLKDEDVSFIHFLPEWQPQWLGCWETVLERLKYKFSSGIGDKVLLVGVDKSSHITEMMVDQIRSMIDKDASLVLSDIEKGMNVDKSIYEYEVEFLTNDIESDEVIITDPWRSRELEAIARSYFRGDARITNPFFPIRHDESNKLITNPYILETFPGRENEEEWYMNFSRLNDIEGVERLAETLYTYQPLFKHVEIETINRCNGSCSFCPVSVGHDIRDRKVMSDELFCKIINELANMNFDGRVALFSNDEPFLDKKIIDRHKYAYEHLPKAKMHLFTNGTLLTLDKFINIIPYLDELIIDNYNQDLMLNPNSKDIAIYCEIHPELKRKVSIMLRKPNEILTSRGGDAPNRKNKKKFIHEKCVLPFEQMIIRPDGKVSLCCNDPYGKMTLGNVSKQTMSEIWYGDKFKEVRTAMIKGRGYLSNCQYCDTFYYSTGV